MFAITGATGHLGRTVTKQLIDKGINPNEIIGLGRNIDRASDLKSLGIHLREANYDQYDSLQNAFKGVKKVLFISGSEVGRRVPQHANVVKALVANKIEYVAYTSLLAADKSPLGLAPEHLETEKLIADSKLSATILRNGWYTENYLSGLNHAIESGQLFGCAGQAKFSTATRDDYAAAAVKVLTSEGHAGQVYELAGDTAFTLTGLTKAISEVVGKEVTYVTLAEIDYANLLVKIGLPEAFAKLLANVETLSQEGWLENNSGTLSKLIGRKTTDLKEAITMAFKKA